MKRSHSQIDGDISSDMQSEQEERRVEVEHDTQVEADVCSIEIEL